LRKRLERDEMRGIDDGRRLKREGNDVMGGEG
jgi:hypothetical protein